MLQQFFFNYNFYIKLFLFLSTIPLIYSIGNNCSLCKDIVNIIEDEIKFSNKTINIIEKGINATCHMIIIKPERDECIAIVDDISLIVKWLINGLYPNQICEKLHFC